MVRRRMEAIHLDSARLASKIHFGVRKAFVKIENFNIVRNGILAPRNPRLICAVGDEENYALGPYVRAIQEAVVDLTKNWLHEHGPMPLFLSACGLDFLDIGAVFKKLEGEGYSTYWSIDKSSFDRTVTTAALDYERYVYRRILPMNKEVETTLIAQKRRTLKLPNLSRVDNLIGRRNSGDPNTTIGNTILCGLTAIEYFLNNNIDAIPLCCGDDLVIFFKKQPTQLQRQAWLDRQVEFGFINKLAVVDDIAQVDFISARVIPCYVQGVETYTLTPLYGKCLPKIFMSTSNIAKVSPARMLTAIKGCMEYCFSADPYILAYFRTVSERFGKDDLRESHKRAIARASWMFTNLATRYSDPHPDLDDFNTRRYGCDCSPFLNGLTKSAKLATAPVFPVYIPSHVCDRDN